ncbi:hypothetical protein [Micropruina sp.]|uniref:hypothetical protein n=1 Tax=Micropruina sp. TaxID=2737536 RepID=UPI0039E4FA11
MTDPWAWLQQEPAEPDIDVGAHRVSAIVLTPVADQVRSLLAEQSVEPAEIIVADTLAEGVQRSTGEWLWLFPQAVRPDPDALRALLGSALESSRIGLVGPLMVQSQRRARVDLIESCGLTVTPIGRLIPAVEGGEPDQGQLSTMAVLGVDASAALVRRDLWQPAGGVLEKLPSALAGLELGRRLNAAGVRVVAEPAARVVRAAPALPDPVEQRAWELRLASSGASWFTRLRLLFGSLLGAIGFLLGKDAAGAGHELRAIERWLGDRPARAALTGREVDPNTLAGLIPTRRELLAHSIDRAAGGLAEAWAELADRETEVSLDELTGDDFAAKGRLRRLSPLAVGAYLVGLLAVLAGWKLLGDGRLTGVGLLPSQQTWADLVHSYLDPIAGQPNLTGPPWLGSTALAALASFGQVEWLVTLGFTTVVPLAWFLALRALRGQGVEGSAAVIAALGYAIAPVLCGAFGGGWLGVLTWAVLLPLLAHALARWAADRSWRAAGAVALWLVFAVVEVPLAWPLVVLAMAVLPAARSARGAGQVAVAALAGAIGLGPALAGWAGFPGRLLTSASPALAPLAEPDPWLLALAHPNGAGVAPLWVSAVVLGVAWLAAVLGLFRRPRAAAPGFVTAGVALLLAVLLSRLVVVVPPGVEARPQPHAWLVLMAGGLMLAAARGLSGLAAELHHRTLGGRHAVVLALSVVMVGAVGLGALWWAWDGGSALRRTTSDSLPPFVRVAMTSGTPVRTLAIARTSGEIRWALVEGDLPRLGEDERGLPGTVEPQRGLAASVVNRLLSGSADDQLSTDLARLGVGYVWLRGSDPDLRSAIGNVPGLGIGTGDDDGATWPVPNAAIATIEGDGEGAVATGDGQPVPAGSALRQLVLAQPVDSRWQASIDGRPLAPLSLADGRQGFQLGTEAGTLHLRLDGGPQVWPWVQLGAVLVLIVLAAPRVRRRS